MSVRLLHIADVHLGAPLENFGPYAGRRRSELEAAFRRAIDVAIERRVHAVLVAGDLFDRDRPEPEVVDLARRELGRLRDADIPVYAVPGTHDAVSRRDSVYRAEGLPFRRLFDAPTFADPESLEVDGTQVLVYGIAADGSGDGWTTLRREPVPGLHVALVHAACRLNPDWPIHPRDLPFDEEELAELGMDYVALGHYHNLRLFRDGERIVGAYSGTLEGRDWTETGDRHAVLVSWEDPAGPPSVEPIPVQTRRLETTDLDVGGAADHEDIVTAIEATCDPEALWEIGLVGEPEFVVRPASIEADLAGRYGHVRVVDRTTLAASHVVAERCQEETVRGEFFRRLVAAREAAGDERERAVADRAIKLGLRALG